MNQWLEMNCPRCRVNNWIDNGDPTDLTVNDVEGFQCWHCGANFVLCDDEFEETDEPQFCADPIPTFCTAEQVSWLKKVCADSNIPGFDALRQLMGVDISRNHAK